MLFVKISQVKKNWRDKKLDLADFGYNEKEY